MAIAKINRKYEDVILQEKALLHLSSDEEDPDKLYF